MTAGVRVAAFAALLAAVFLLSAIAGRAIDPAADAGESPSMPSMHDGAPAAAGDGLRLVAGTTTLTAGTPRSFTFRVLDARGATLRAGAFQIEQGRRMHLIIVRRDLRHFQHLHPEQDASGAWRVPITLPAAGVYQAYADFQTAGTRQTLGFDLFAAGRFEPRVLPAPSTSARADGYNVALGTTHDAGRLNFTVSRNGAPVADLQPYLGARGHLVMLRAGDLAYEHVHPLAQDALVFDAGHSAPGTYRLFLQFRHGDAVHTAAFTREVAP
jgi:hypothetical protein